MRRHMLLQSTIKGICAVTYMTGKSVYCMIVFMCPVGTRCGKFLTAICAFQFVLVNQSVVCIPFTNLSERFITFGIDTVKTVVAFFLFNAMYVDIKMPSGQCLF